MNEDDVKDSILHKHLLGLLCSRAANVYQRKRELVREFINDKNSEIENDLSFSDILQIHYLRLLLLFI
jgi:hypothetical protein